MHDAILRWCAPVVQVTHPHEDVSFLVRNPFGQWRAQIFSWASDVLGAAAASVTGSKRASRPMHSGHCSAKLQAAGLESVVQIGGRSGHYSANVSANPITQLCYAAGGYVSGALHHVVVGSGDEGPLDALATYFYR